MSTGKIDTEELFSDRLRRLRKLNKLSQVALAKCIGISNDYISKIEKGDRSPKEWVVEKIQAWMDSVEFPKETGKGEMKKKEEAVKAPEIAVTNEYRFVHDVKHPHTDFDEQLMQDAIRMAVDITTVDIEKVALKIYYKSLKDKYGGVPPAAPPTEQPLGKFTASRLAG